MALEAFHGGGCPACGSADIDISYPRKKDAPTENPPLPKGVLSVVDGLTEIRHMVDAMWPVHCCPKGVLRESNGKETTCCVEDCPWASLYEVIATVQVDASILESKFDASPK